MRHYYRYRSGVPQQRRCDQCVRQGGDVRPQDVGDNVLPAHVATGGEGDQDAYGDGDGHREQGDHQAHQEHDLGAINQPGDLAEVGLFQANLRQCLIEETETERHQCHTDYEKCPAGEEGREGADQWLQSLVDAGRQFIQGGKGKMVEPAPAEDQQTHWQGQQLDRAGKQEGKDACSERGPALVPPQGVDEAGQQDDEGSAQAGTGDHGEGIERRQRVGAQQGHRCGRHRRPAQDQTCRQPAEPQTVGTVGDLQVASQERR